eukprot:TRINITY_DN29914_c0_g1_i2.p1 TRINITY_DN29914_c0_g1~~TRINITY_DN29914_c0_g1_i2.p1  ORF type:complete len:150 (-),score=41.17 TRINITY_DN29914_c0_g1_i2:179-628(-)
MIRRPPRSTQGVSSAASDVYKRQTQSTWVSAEEALEYACWLVKADKLYDIALQTYDINVVLMVAKHTQKDPKEYLPYLKSLQILEPVYRRYQIQKDLKQFGKALFELSLDPEKYTSEAIELIEKYKLYEEALEYFKLNKTMLQLSLIHI